MPDSRWRKVERDALGAEQRRRRPDDLSDLFAGPAAVAVLLARRDLDARIELAECLHGHVEARDDAVAFDEKDAARPADGWTVAAVVTSPSRMSSSSARRTTSR